VTSLTAYWVSVGIRYVSFTTSLGQTKFSGTSSSTMSTSQITFTAAE